MSVLSGRVASTETSSLGSVKDLTWIGGRAGMGLPLATPSPHRCTGCAAARALAVAKSSRSTSSTVAYLADLLTWPQWYVRQSACWALGSMRHGLPQAIVATLFELRRDPRSNAVQHAADRALVAILSADNGAIEDDTVEMASM
jgi:HEAT repeats